MGKSLSLAALLVVLLSCAPCFGDGKVIPKTAMAKVTIPDQRAFIAYRNGIEHLAIETNFQGEGKDFAWIIPTPSPPEVRAVSSGFFPTLQALLLPKIKHRYLEPYIPTFEALFWILLLCIICFLIYKLNRSAEARCFCYVLLFFVIIMIGFLMPTTMSGGVSFQVPPTISIHQTARVGAYEVMSLSSEDAQDLVTWLKQNDYKVSVGSAKAIEEYVKKDWIFTAVKLAVAPDGQKTYSPHPLAFVFKTDKPVYPLKLTGVDNGRCHIELYVFGPRRAEAEGFKILRCTKPEYPPLDEKAYSKDRPNYYYKRRYTFNAPHLSIRHKELRGAIGDAPVMTRLSRTFDPGEMTEDALLTWHPFSERQEVYYSLSYVLQFTITWCAIIWTILLLSFPLMVRLNKKKVLFRNIRIKGKNYFICYVMMSALFIGITLGFFLYGHFPQKGVTLLDASDFYSAVELYPLIMDRLAWDKEKGRIKGGIITKKMIHNELTAFIREDNLNNIYTGEPFKEENSPGNYMLRGTEDSPELVYFDETGGEVIVWPEEEEE